MPRAVLIALLLVIIFPVAICIFAYDAYEMGYFSIFSNQIDLAEHRAPSNPPQKADAPWWFAPVRKLPDADALAARVPKYNAIYQKVRDDALAAYAQKHPGQHDYDEDNRSFVRLVAYLSVRGDFYGEGLGQDIAIDSDALEKRCYDPLWCAIGDVFIFDNFSHAVNDAEASHATHLVTELGGTSYPALIKNMAFADAIFDLVDGKATKPSPLHTSLADLPVLTSDAVKNYAELIAEHLPNDILFAKADALFKAAEEDGPTLQALADGIDQDFKTNDPNNPVASAIQGDFYTTFAWTARGSGESETVTPEGWQLFGDRLASAEGILTDAFDKNPEEASISRVMITVTMGRQESRDQMEEWFQRGIKADPDNFSIYMAKRRYLLPRWFGTQQELWNYGTECAASDNWAAKIPTVLIEAIEDAAEYDKSVYAKPEVWGPVEKVFRDYLERYPDALTYRTRFLQCAVYGGHWDVANEQLKIMNGDWDRMWLSKSNHDSLVQQAKAHSGATK